MNLASASRRLRALVDGLTLTALRGDVAEISADPALAALARSSTRDLEDLLTRAARRPIAVSIVGPGAGGQAGEVSAEVKGAPAPDIRQHPLVKAAEDLFGARVVRVEARPQ